jgi:hypothetical protein
MYCHNHNILNFQYEVGLNTILTIHFQHTINLLLSYQVFQILYVTYYKLNAMTYVFIILLKDILSLLSYV